MKDEFLQYCEELDAQDYLAELVVFEKGDMVSTISATALSNGGVVTILDPRNETPTVVAFPDLATVRLAFSNALQTSLDRGWKIIKRARFPKIY